MSDPIGPREPRRLRSVDLRGELAAFAEAMEHKLVANDHKAHWNSVPIGYLLGRLREELEELDAAISLAGYDDVQNEAVDVANFAMMIFDSIEHQR